jgi:hypothetical protein
MVGRSAGRFRLHAVKPLLGQVEPVDENVNHANGIVLGDVVLQ